MKTPARHRWGDKVVFPHKSERDCINCGLVKVSRHEVEGGKDRYWTEYWRDEEKVGTDRTPVCERVGVCGMNAPALNPAPEIYHYDRDRAPGVYVAIDMSKGVSREQALLVAVNEMVAKTRRYMENKDGEGTCWSEGFGNSVIAWALSLSKEAGLVQAAAADVERESDQFGSGDDEGRRAALFAIMRGEPVDGQIARDLVGEGFLHATTTKLIVTDEGRAFLASDGDRVIEDSNSEHAGNLNQPSDSIVAALLADHRARKIFPARHAFSMTNPIEDGRILILATCKCGYVVKFGANDQLRADAAIEAHWQHHDDEPDKIDGRGQPIGGEVPAAKPKRQRKRKPSDAPEGIPASIIADASSPPEALRSEPAPSPMPPDGAGSLLSEDAPIGAGSLAHDMAAEPADDWSPLLNAALDLAWREPVTISPLPGPVADEQLHPKVRLLSGSCLDALPLLEENSIDSCVCDPPYHLTTGKKGGSGIASLNENSPAGRARISTGFMGKAWDGGDVAFQVETWRQVFRVLKPGAHLIAFSGTRTYHRMVCAIEDAGFEIRDQIGWLYGSGFPKSRDISKAIDKEAGAEREVISEGEAVKRMIPGADQNVAGWEKNDGRVYVPTETAPATDAAKQWDGWGTALKPSQEPVVVARKPLSEKTVAANVLRWGTGAINVDGCRVGTESTVRHNHGGTGNPEQWRTGNGEDYTAGSDAGRWPANIIHDGSEEVLETFPVVGDSHPPANAGSIRKNEIFGADNEPRTFHAGFPDSGSAARFFYAAKADDDERIASKHPTIKPVDLMQYLTRLVTPPRGVVLDPFAGTGTTGEGAFREGFSAVLVEREAEYQDDIRRRVRLMLAGPEERSREIVKQKLKDQPMDPGPLFGGSDSPPPPHDEEIAEFEV